MPSKKRDWAEDLQEEQPDALAIWTQVFSAAAVADHYGELLRPLKHLGLECPEESVLDATVALVSAVVNYARFDGREYETFLKLQHYRLDANTAIDYCLLFDLSGKKGSYFGRIMTDATFSSIDLEDLFNHPWDGSETAGFARVYITRLDGEEIEEQELDRLDEQVRSDMFFGHSDEDLAAYVSMTEFSDTALIYAVELD